MKRLLLHFVLFAALAGIALLAVVRLGLYDISATDQHLRPTYIAIKAAMEHSVELRSRNIVAPPMDDPARLELGAALFRLHCVQCHGAPGVAPEPFAMALRPLATPLARSGLERTSQHLYWVVKHGIKMTGMPAWEFRFSEEEIWAVVAFVKRLPALTPAQYASDGRRATRAAAEAAAGTAATDEADAAPDTTAGEADAARGKRALEQYACVSCHDIPGVIGPEARLGPTLHGIGSRGMLGGVLPNSPQNMADWIRAPQAFAPGTAMPSMGVTPRDARDIAAYLATLR